MAKIIYTDWTVFNFDFWKRVFLSVMNGRYSKEIRWHNQKITIHFFKESTYDIGTFMFISNFTYYRTNLNSIYLNKIILVNRHF